MVLGLTITTKVFGWATNIGSVYYMYRSERNYKLVVEALHQVFGKV